MTSLLKRGAFAVLASLLVALVSANATVTGEFRIAIDPAKEVSVFFSPTTTGTIRVESVFKPLGNKYSIKLLRSDQPEPLAQAEGIDALTLTFAVDRPLPGVSWHVMVQNLADRTLSGLVEITYPRANCKELAAEFSLDLRYVNENVPLQDEQCLVVHKTMRSIPEESRSGLQKIIAFPQVSTFKRPFASMAICKEHGWHVSSSTRWAITFSSLTSRKRTNRTGKI
ncbi:hypothetical protein HY230_02020 [Candidatus Acetothermia bacterium]|nr:hypothetical protein [Candidatus Acetothermia bacterium]